MEIGDQVTARVRLLGTSTAFLTADLAHILAHLLLVGFVQLHHATTGEMEGVGGGEEGEQSDLHSGVVEDLVLALLVGGIAVLELATHGSITGGNGDTPGENTTGLQDNGAADPGQGAVDERGRSRADVFAGLGVDAGEAGEHANVRHLDLVEQQEAVVHGVVAKLGANVSNVDVGQRLVRLEVSDLHDKRVRAIRLALDDELGHDDSVVCSAAQRANPPLGGRQ